MKVKVKVYSIVWPHAEKPMFSFCEMPECVTIGSQEVELEVIDLGNNHAELIKQQQIEQLKQKQRAIESQIRSLEQ